jgi:hypothetical protein
MGKKSRKKKGKELPEDRPQGVSINNFPYIYWAGIIIIILLIVFIRLRLMEIPLERDEGEFAYMGQLMLQGIPPYLISYNMKLPGIYAAYAVIMLFFGQSTAGIHLGFIIINVATIILVFLIATHLFDQLTGFVAGASFAILSLSPTVLGTSAHATHFVLLPALAGFLVLFQSTESGKAGYIFWSGILLGLSFLMKQSGIFFVIFASLYLVYRSSRARNFSLQVLLRQECFFLMGAAIPLAITCGVLYFTGVFEKFWFWTFSYASQYVSLTPLSRAFKSFLDHFEGVIGKFYLLWGIAVVGTGFLFIGKTYRAQKAFVLGLLVFSLLAVCPGFYFRKHYFVLILPAVSILIGIGLNGLTRSIASLNGRLQFVPISLFVVFSLVSLFQYRSFLFEWTPYQACQATYFPNPFVQSIEVAKYIETHSQQEDKIVVLGSEPQIYFYANRHSATGYIYMYSLMEDHKYALQMQNEMIEEVEKAKPSYLVFVNVPTSWLARQSSRKYIIEWFDRYHQKNLDLVGVVDIISSVHTEYRWGREAQIYSPQSSYFLHIFKRKRI